jgi:shikimate kinase
VNTLPGRVLLVGMMGSGKTTVGRELARRTGWPFLDNDVLVRELTGREPKAIDAEDGEDALHRAEIRALQAAMARPGSAIIALAAAIIDDASATADVRASGVHVVWLRGRPETLRNRIGAGAGRRSDAQDLDWIAARAADRAPRYRAIADQVIDIEDKRPRAIAQAILGSIGFLPAGDEAAGDHAAGDEAADRDPPG